MRHWLETPESSSHDKGRRARRADQGSIFLAFNQTSAKIYGLANILAMPTKRTNQALDPYARCVGFRCQTVYRLWARLVPKNFHLEICVSPFGHVYGVLNVVKQQN